MQQVIEYYKEFNKIRNYRNDVSLLMLSYFAKYGDENIKSYEFRKRQPQKALPKDIQEREDHKYDLYERVYQIVKGETELE